MYRPKDWKNKHIHCTTTSCSDSCYGVFEAGADAMLEGLREKGLTDTFYTNKDGEVCGESSLPLHIPCGDKRVKGSVVFIPDEQVKKDE